MNTITFSLLWNISLATVLAIVVWLMSRLPFFQRRPALNHTLWLLVLAKLVTPPVIPVPVFRGINTAQTVQQASVMEVGANVVELPSTLIEQPQVAQGDAGMRPTLLDQSAKTVNSSIPWLLILLGTSAFGTLVLVVRGVTQWRRVSQLLRVTRGADPRLVELARVAADRMGVAGIPTICTVETTISPLLWVRGGVPVIVLPLPLIETMSDDQVVCILCHELAHYVRRDHWSNVFAFLVTALFWWHPAAWWARREMLDGEEVCCDGLAFVAGGANRRCYAETLLQTVEFIQTQQPLRFGLVSAFGRDTSLKRRFEMIANLNVSHRYSQRVLLFAIPCIAAMVCMPVRAQLNADGQGGWMETSAMQHDHPISILTCNTDWIAVGDEGGYLYVWDTKTRQERRLMMKGGKEKGANSSVDRLQFTHDGKALYAVLDGRKSVWQLKLEKNPEKPSPGLGGSEPFYFGFSADCEYWLELYVGGTVLALRKNMWTGGNTIDYETVRYETEITHAALSADDKWLAVVTADEKLHIHDRATLRETQTIALTKQPVMAIQFSPDGKRLALVGEQSLAKVYDTTSGNEVATLKEHDGIVFAVAFSPDGKTIVTGGDDGIARLWDVATGKSLALLRGHTDSIKAVSFDLNGTLLFTGSADKLVKVWTHKEN